MEVSKLLVKYNSTADKKLELTGIGLKLSELRQKLSELIKNSDKVLKFTDIFLKQIYSKS